MRPETWLVALTGVKLPRGTVLALDRTIILGRWVDAGIRLPDNEVARRHSRFRPTAEGCLLEDLGSTNGSIVNGVMIQQAILRDGDSYIAGHSTFCVVVGPRSRADEVAAQILATEEHRLHLYEGLRAVQDAVSHAVYEATVHRRPLTLLAVGWRRPDPLGLFTILEASLPAARLFPIALRVFALLETKPDTFDVAAKAGVHFGVATLARPAEHPGPYDTRDPVARLFEASRSALEIALATDEAVCEAEPVLLRPA